MAKYDVVRLRSSKPVKVQPLVPRLKSLEGATVAFLWDCPIRGDEIRPVLSGEIGDRRVC